MAVTYQNKSEHPEGVVTTTLTMTIPAGWSAGDLLIAVITKDDDFAITPPAGATWQTIETLAEPANKDCRLGVYYRIAEAGDTSWDWTGDSEQWYGVILRYTGHTGTPIYDSAIGNGDSNAPQAPSVAYTDLETGSIALHVFGADDDDTPYTTTGLTERYNGISSVNPGSTGGAGGEVAASGTGSTGTFDFGMNAVEEWVAATVVIEAAVVVADRNINVSDSVGVAENVEASNPTLFGSASDSITVTDTPIVQKETPPDLEVDVSDSVTVTENAAADIPINIRVSGGAWYNPSWDYRVKITVQAGKVDADLTDFPIYVSLNDLPAGFHTNVKSDGGDIRVTEADGETELPREVVFYDSATDTGELYFKADGVLSSSSNTDFYIYYGVTGPDSVETYYFNTSDDGPLDPDTAWSSDEDAFNGATGSGATCSTAGTVDTNELQGDGTDAPITGGEITKVRARIYASQSLETDVLNAAIYTDSLAELLGTATWSSAVESWGNYADLSIPSGGWTWAKVQALEAKFYLGQADGTVTARKVEIEVTSTYDYSTGTSIDTHYFDGSDVPATQDGVGWSDVTNADDGATGTLASTATAGTVDDDYLIIEGTNAPGSSSTIFQVRARIFGYRDNDGAGALNSTIYTDGLTDILGIPQASIVVSPGDWGSYVTLDAPPGGWTWVKVQALEIKLYKNGSFTNCGASKVEIEVTSGPQYGTASVWNDNYLAVYHLQEAANDVADNYKDSTSNANHGQGSSMAIAPATGKLAGNAAEFDGSEDYISLPYIITNNTWSITAWMNLERLDGSNGAPIYYQGTGSADNGTANFGSVDDYPSAGDQSVWARSGGATIATSTDQDYTTGTWYHWGGTFNNTDVDFYFDGGTAGTGTVDGTAYADTGGAIAAWYDYTAPARFTDGFIDELRITDNVLPSTWISTEYNNQSDTSTFYNVDAEEGQTGGDVVAVSEYVELNISSIPEINVSDSITVSENIEADTEDLSTDVSDSITVSEYVELSVEVLGDRDVITSDNVGVADSPEMNLSVPIYASDSINTAESVNADAEDLDLSVSDSITVTESVELYLAIPIYAQDSVTVAEDITADAEDLYVDVSDSVTVAENVNAAKEGVAPRNLITSDSVGVAESVEGYIEIPVETSDSITITESILAQATISVVASDSITITENVEADAQDLNLAVSDEIATTEAVELSISLSAYSQDTVTVTENVQGDAQDLSFSVQDSITITEYVEGATEDIGSRSVAASDSVGVAENIEMLLEVSIVTSDSIATSENIDANKQPVAIRTFSVSDSITITENIEAAADEEDLSLSVSDTVTVTDTPAAAITTSVYAQDSINTTENVNADASDLFITTDDSIVITEYVEGSVEEIGARSFSVSDTITVADSPEAKVSDLEIKTSDTVDVAENVIANQTTGEMELTVSDSVGVEDILPWWAPDQIGVSDSIPEVFITTEGVVVHPYASDTILVSENTNFYVLLEAEAQDSTTVTESVKMNLLLHVRTDDSVGTAEDVEVFIAIPVKVEDQISVAEAVSLTIPTSLATSDTVDLTESISLEIPVSIYTSDSITVDESVNADAQDLSINTSDTIDVAESVEAAIPTALITSDTVTITENVELDIPTSIYASDSITVTESTDVAIVFGIYATDTIAVSELVSGDIPLNIDVSDSVAVTESINGDAQDLKLITSDSIDVAESTDVDIPLLAEASDSIVISEYVELDASSLVSGFSVSDAITVTENTDLAIPTSLYASDEVTVTENVEAEIPDSAYTSDSVTVTENVEISVSIIAGKNITESDTVTVSESVQVSIPFDIAVSDSITVSEDLGVSSVLLLSVSDSISVTENIEGLAAFDVVVSDAVVVSESTEQATSGPQISVQDSVAIAENVQAGYVWFIQVSDTINVVDYPNYYDDTIFVYENWNLHLYTPVPGVYLTELESIGVSENVHITMNDLEFAVSDSVSLSESIEAARAYDGTAYDEISVSENVQMEVSDCQLKTSETIPVSEAIAYTLTIECWEIEGYPGGGWTEEGVPVSSWATESEPTSNWTTESVPSTDYEVESTPTTSWTDESEPECEG